MPPERLSRPDAAKFAEEASLPLKTESEGPKSGGNSRGIRHIAEDRKQCYINSLVVAVLRGCSERVSAAKFPDPRENTGNFPRNVPPRLHEALERRGFFGRIPCNRNREFFSTNREKYRAEQRIRKVCLVTRSGHRNGPSVRQLLTDAVEKRFSRRG